MKFTKAYVREAVAAEKAGMKFETKPPKFPAPEELKEKFRNDPQARVRGSDAGSAKGIPVSFRRREAVWGADRAHREGDACIRTQKRYGRKHSACSALASARTKSSKER